MTRLTKDQAIKIYRSTARLVDDAKNYGVTDTTISQIKRGKTWRHATNAPLEATTRNTLKLLSARIDQLEKDVKVLKGSYGELTPSS